MFSPTLLDHVCVALKKLTFIEQSVAKHASNKIKTPKDNYESNSINVGPVKMERERRKEEFVAREGRGGAFKMHNSSMRVIQGV